VKNSFLISPTKAIPIVLSYIGAQNWLAKEALLLASYERPGIG
jgi:hypothetical protein